MVDSWLFVTKPLRRSFHSAAQSSRRACQACEGKKCNAHRAGPCIDLEIFNDWLGVGLQPIWPHRQGSTRAPFWPGLPSPGSKFREGFALTKFPGSANLQGLPSHSCRNGRGLKTLQATQQSTPQPMSTMNFTNLVHCQIEGTISMHGAVSRYHQQDIQLTLSRWCTISAVPSNLGRTD